MVKQRRLSVLAVGTLVNPADVFTKQLGVARVMMLLYLMRVVEMHRYKRMGKFEFAGHAAASRQAFSERRLEDPAGTCATGS